MKKIKYLLLLLLISCSSKNEIEVTFITKELLIPNKNFNLGSIPFDKMPKSLLKFKIKNNSNSNYYITNYCFNNPNDNGCSNSKKSFPNGNLLDLNNIIFTNIKKNKVLDVNTIFVDRPNTITKKLNLRDSIKLNNYRHLGYDDDWLYLNDIISNKIILLKAQETTYFETYTTLPYNIELGQSIQFKKEMSYNIRLHFKSSKEVNIKKHLRWSQLELLRENNYELYPHDLKSINTIPIKFSNDVIEQ